MTEDIFALKIENDIKALYTIGEKATVYPVINSISNALRNNVHFIMPTRQSAEMTKILRGDAKAPAGADSQIHFLQIKAEEGKFFIPLFTSFEEFQKGEKVSMVRFPFSRAIQMVENNPAFAGFVINPYGKKFVLREKVLKAVKTFTPHCILTISKGSVLDMDVDLIVNAANESLRGGGGIDGEIHYHAGPKLLDECIMLEGCKTGEAKLTRSHNLKHTKGIIHTVGPIYSGSSEDADLLASCYANSLDIAYMCGATSIAFPCISTGVYGYPLDKAANVAFEAITKWIKTHPGAVMNIYVCCYRPEELAAYGQLAKQNQNQAANTDSITS